MTDILPPQWQMDLMALGQSGTKGLHDRFRDEYYNTRGQGDKFRRWLKYPTRHRSRQARRRNRMSAADRQYAMNAYNAIKEAEKLHSGLYRYWIYKQVGWRPNEIRNEGDYNRFLRDVENAGGMDAIKAKAAQNAWNDLERNPNYREQRARWSKYLKPAGSGKPAPVGGGGQGSGGGMPGGSGGGFGGGMPGGGGTGMPGGMPGGFGGGTQGGRGGWSHGSGLPGGNNSMGDSFSGSRGNRRSDQYGNRRGDKGMWAPGGRARPGTTMSGAGGRYGGGRPSTGLAGGRGQTGGRYGRPMPPRNPRGGGVAGGGRWNWNPGTRQWDDRGGQGGRGRMSQNDFRRRYANVDGSRPGRGGWPTRGQKIGGYRVGGRKKPTPGQFANVDGSRPGRGGFGRPFRGRLNVGGSRSRQQGRKTPYMQRGYGRRFDRFRKGLGSKRPAPIGGSRGGGSSRGGGGFRGFVNPYSLARRRGYKGSYADWMQTEDGQKYQRNIEAGWKY